MPLDDLTSEIIKAAINVYKVLGPGLFESVYEEVLAYELTQSGFHVERQVAVPGSLWANKNGNRLQSRLDSRECSGCRNKIDSATEPNS